MKRRRERPNTVQPTLCLVRIYALYGVMLLKLKALKFISKFVNGIHSKNKFVLLLLLLRPLCKILAQLCSNMVLKQSYQLLAALQKELCNHF